MKTLKNQNKMLFKLDNNTITSQYLNKIKNIKKKSYDSPRIYNSSISGESYSIDSSILYLGDWEGENPLRREINKLDHVVSTNIKYNQVNDVILNELEFYSSNSTDNNNVKDPLTISLEAVKTLDIPLSGV